MMSKLGLIGLGNIGEPVCRNLLKGGYEVVVYDAGRAAMTRLEDTGAEPAESPRELASVADVVLLSLPNSAVIEEVVLGENGLLESLSPGKVLIDTSSSKPSSTRMISERLAEAGVDMLDAPVSGGVIKAREGTLAVMVGGNREVFEKCYPIFDAFGGDVFFVGDHGAGHLTKALNNLLSATTLASASEAVILAERAGLSPELFVEVINASNGRSYSTEVKFPKYILDRSFDDGFATALMNKDLKIALEAAAEMDFPMLIGSTVAQVWQAAVAQGNGARSHTEIFAFLENMTGGRETEDGH
ncbi:MAG TPA: NAD(P)-dependent oxidoreductase [Rubrobacteraceae bacterium]|nr:NAD(P)-dependent oxidoreductase [Rubrobacteraceae bacterium]